MTPILGILASQISGNLAPTSIELLVVGGGANSSGPVPGAGGGGGAGGYLTSTPTITTGATYTITVGGSQSPSSWNGTITALAGGTASGNGASSNGYSGTFYPGGTGTPGQGYNGGGTADGVNAGGGGGAGGAGGNAGFGNPNEGASGIGVANSISGTSVTYCVGGRGGGYSAYPTPSGPGSGASGPGYNAFGTNYGQPGIVILRYPDNYQAATSTTGSPTITVAGGYRVYSFANNGSITF